ncbi:MAG: hypothetical protein KJO07_01880 [Deltaproteobacteria bacterium]|nr:hypothetical protein [Deltaproteobacteria bacterium]
MRAFLTLLATVALVLTVSSSALALNNDDTPFLTDPDVVEATTCWLEIQRPDDPTGDPRANTQCNCVLVGPDAVLTNSACVALNVEEGDAAQQNGAGIEVRFQSGTDSTPVYTVTDITLSRFYDPLVASVDGLSGPGFTEFALLRLDGDPVGDGAADVAILNTDPLPGNFEGSNVRIVGFGANAMGGLFEATERAIELPSRNIQFTHFAAGTVDSTTCRYDDGAPVFAQLGGEWKLVAITANDLLDRCFDNLNRMRIDRFANDFIIPYIARTQQGGTDCDADGVCGTDCVLPDVDCDTCDFQGGGAADCDASCSPRDFDCELGAFPGIACENDSDCEFGGTCVAAEDDSTFTYCSVTCDSAGASAPSACANDTTCTTSGAGEACLYGTPSRGSQGWDCTDNAECRSDICEGNICVFECTGTCPAGTECLPSDVQAGVNVCRVPGDSGGGGFCAVGGDNAPYGLIVIGLFLGLGAIRRRS